MSRGKAFGSPPAACPPERPRPFARYRIKPAGMKLGARRLRGRTATQRPKKGSEKVLGRVLGKGFWGRGSQKGSEKVACFGFCSKKGF